MKLDVRADVAAAIAARRPVVALESTVIAHGLPKPLNLETARGMENEIRGAGAIAATIALASGSAGRPGGGSPPPRPPHQEEGGQGSPPRHPPPPPPRPPRAPGR